MRATRLDSDLSRLYNYASKALRFLGWKGQIGLMRVFEIVGKGLIETEMLCILGV